jgi:hypothetical protein
MKGHVETTYFSYAAKDERLERHQLSDEKQYIASRTTGLHEATISNVTIENIDDLEKPVTFKYDFERELYDPAAEPVLLFNPFTATTQFENPFKSKERLYPVEFEVPIDVRVICNIEFPEGLHVKSIPENVALALPNSGGRYLFQAKVDGSKVSFSSNFVISRTFYSSEEYHYLKEIFARMIQTQATDMVIERK